MQLSPSTYQVLAHSILARQVGDGLEADALQRAVDQVFGQLLLRLARLIGETGSRALFVRSVHLVRHEFPFLDPLQLSTPEACRQTVGQAIQTVEPELAYAGVTALLANCLELLASFIGEDLVRILAGEIWPDLPGGGASDD